MLPGFSVLSKWRDSNPRPFGPEQVSTFPGKLTGMVCFILVLEVLGRYDVRFFFYNTPGITLLYFFLLETVRIKY